MGTNWDGEKTDDYAGIAELEFHNDWNAAGGRVATLGITSYTTLHLLGCFVDSIVCGESGHFESPEDLLSSLICRFPVSLLLKHSSGGTYSNSLKQATEVAHKAVFAEPWYFLTRKGLLGVCDNDLETGDELSILFGGNVPFVLRPAPSTPSMRPSYGYLGHSYVHGIMNGEVLEKNTAEQWIDRPPYTPLNDHQYSSDLDVILVRFLTT